MTGHDASIAARYLESQLAIVATIIPTAEHDTDMFHITITNTFGTKTFYSVREVVQYLENIKADDLGYSDVDKVHQTV